MLGFRLGIGTGIEDVANAVFIWQCGGDARAVHSGQGPQLQGRSRHRGTRISSGNKSIRTAILDHVHRDADRRKLFLPHCLGTRLGHADHLRGVDDAHPRVVEIESLSMTLVLQDFLDSHQIKVLELRIITQRVDGSSDIDGRGVVPTHGIQGDFHAGLRIRLEIQRKITARGNPPSGNELRQARCQLQRASTSSTWRSR